MADDNGSYFKREPAVRLFAQELSQTSLSTGKEEGKKADRFAPAYSFSPTGAKINRIFIVGALTEVDEIETQNATFVKARLVDSTGGIGIMAGQFQPEAVSVLRELAGKLPAFVAVVGKPNIYKPADGGSYTSIRPEDIHVVDEKIAEIWTSDTAKRTLERIKILKEAMAAGKCSEELKSVIAAYSPNIEELKHMVKVGIGKAALTEYRPKNNGDGSGAKTSQTAPAGEQTKAPTPPAPAQAPAQAPEIDESVKAAHALLKDMCALSEDGTVGGSAFADRLVQRKLASPDTALSLIKSVMDQGFAYEPQMGRLKAVA
jgi:RPA family protein